MRGALKKSTKKRYYPGKARFQILVRVKSYFYLTYKDILPKEEKNGGRVGSSPSFVCSGGLPAPALCLILEQTNLTIAIDRLSRGLYCSTYDYY